MEPEKTTSEEKVEETPKPVTDAEQFVLDTLLDESKGVEKESSEPEIKVEETPPPSPADAKGEDDLSRALSTIAELQSKVEELVKRPSGVTPEALRAEPEIEMVEYFKGLRVAKDPTKRPIRVTDEDLIKAGWNENPANAIEVMANTFYQLIAASIPQLVENQRTARTRVEEEGHNRENRFNELFPDLKAHGELMEIVERNERKNGADRRFAGKPEEYFQQIGRAGRTRVAQLRGLSLEQYESSLKTTKTEPTTVGASRQRTTPQASRSGSPGKVTEQQAFLEDTLKDT